MRLLKRFALLPVALWRTLVSLLTYLRLRWAGDTSKVVAYQRQRACEKCAALDTYGERLYRFHGTEPTCGRPRHLLPVRDDREDGCGCWLRIKWTKEGAECPLGRWPKD